MSRCTVTRRRLPFFALTALALAVLPPISLATPEVAESAPAPQIPVEIVGSVTFHALATIVAARASLTPDGADYQLRPTGTLAGIGAFCAGVGPGFPEVVNASRRMRDDEVSECRAHGVDGIVEVKVGYDGVALATVKGPGGILGQTPEGTETGSGLDLGVRDLYLALAAQVPDPEGGEQLVPNPYRSWREVNPDLPDVPIRVLGSEDASGTRDTLSELGLEAGCAQVEAVRHIIGRNRHRLAEVCRPLRADGAWREIPGQGAELLQALRADPEAVAVTGWHTLFGKRVGLKTLAVEGVPPSPLAIATGMYPLTRPLYVYFKKAHLESLPAIQRYVAEVTSDAAWGDDGYLTAAGMVPMMVDERQKYGYIAEHWVEPACPPFCR